MRFCASWQLPKFLFQGSDSENDFSPAGMCKRAGAYTSSGKIFGDTFL